MNNKQVAHLWAHQSKPSASGSHFFFQGDTIYSYGGHFPIARLYKGVVLFTTQGYSSTTAHHKSIASSAVSHLKVYHVTNPTKKPSAADLKDYQRRIDALIAVVAKSRKPENHMAYLDAIIDEANQFATEFKFKTRFKAPTDFNQLREQAKAAAAAEAKKKIAAAKKLEKELAADINLWRIGEKHSLPFTLHKVYLRAANVDSHADVAVMQSSKGAEVPLTDAKKAFRFVTAMREKGWHRNGETFKVGNFQLDAVNAQGVVAGCHTILWDEIERFARTQGWVQ